MLIYTAAMILPKFKLVRRVCIRLKTRVELMESQWESDAQRSDVNFRHTLEESLM